MMLDISPKPALNPASSVTAVREVTGVSSTGTGRGRRAELLGLAAIFGQLALIALIMRNANVETSGFHRIVYIAGGGFIFHHLLPLRFRLPAFALLSIAAMVLVLGGSPNARVTDLALGLPRAGLILAIGASLVAICHLRIGYWQRVALLVVVGLGIAIFRAGIGESGSFALVWPLLAAMFMFRIMGYLYDVANSPKPPSASQALAYFFLLPNVCTLLFPVIDFRTFCTKYYDEDAFVIYQRGVKWMARGVIHLLLYRLVDQVLALDASDVADGTDLIRFVIANTFLYLKVSGGFHLVIGMLLLFGFNLPETNHRYFLASSFTDYWRRVNIYWRAFIMKVFYYPTYFRVKKLGQTRALILATGWCFFVTWALHLYQTWWVKGEVSFTWPDALFWTALAVLVMANSLSELKRNRRRKVSKGGYKWREAFGLALRTAMTFAVISILWSLWSTPTFDQWLHIWSLADVHTLTWGGVVLGGVMIAKILFEVVPAESRGFSPGPIAGDYVRTTHFLRNALQTAVPLILICFITHPAVRWWFNSSHFQQLSGANTIVRILVDGETQGQGGGYYENLTAVDEGTSQFWETMDATYSQPFVYPMRSVKDVRFHELKPNIHLEKNGVRVDTNRWGMLDHDYELAKTPGTFRIAVLGSSHVMGYGLPVIDTFGPALEQQLNEVPQFHGDRFEVMNFAISGYSPLGQIWLIDNRVSAFHPDLVLFVAQLVDFSWVSRDVVMSLRKRIPLVDGFPSQIMKQAGVGNGAIEVLAKPRLSPYEPAMLSFCYTQIVNKSRSINALPVCIFLPVPDDLPLDKTKVADLLHLARDAGFVTVDLSDIYTGYDPKELQLKERGHHSNAKANTIIAAALHDRLTTDPRIDLLNRAQVTSKGISVEGSATRSSP